MKTLRLLLPALLLFLVAFGQAASAHPGGGQHQTHVTQAASHHAKADNACCGDLSQDEVGKACLAQCLASCGYCAPLPLPTNFAVAADRLPTPRAAEPMHGAISAPHPRPPSIS